MHEHIPDTLMYELVNYALIEKFEYIVIIVSGFCAVVVYDAPYSYQSMMVMSMSTGSIS